MNSAEALSSALFDWNEVLHIDELRVGEHSFKNIPATLSYDHDLRLVAKVELTGSAFAFLAVHDDSNDSFTKGSVKFGIFQRSLKLSSEGGAKLEFIPKSSPAIILRQGEARSFIFKVVNGPCFEFDDFKFRFETGNNGIEYHHIYTKPEERKLIERKNGSLITGSIVITELNGEALSFEDAFKRACNFQRFLTFAGGTQPGIGHAEGFDGDERVCFAPSFNRRDQLHSITNWFGISQISEAASVNEKFQNALEGEAGDVLGRCLEFYRASTAVRPSSIELAIVSSSAALEVIVPHILSSYAKMDANLLNERIPFHSKVRACFGIVGLNCDPLEKSTALLAKMSALNNVDAYEMSSMFRNRIVHQGKNFTVTGIELYEMWNLQMWMIEILIFFLIDHRGSMQDRRPTQGWAGAATPIPLN